MHGIRAIFHDSEWIKYNFMNGGGGGGIPDGEIE